MIAKTDDDFAGLKEIGGIIRMVLDEMETAVRPGVSTWELDQIAGELFKKHGARSAPMLAYKFRAIVASVFMMKLPTGSR